MLTIQIFLTLFLPIIILCTILNLIASAQNRHLYFIGGWKGLLLTAWIGTPIHELSHAIAAILFGHKIVEIKFFEPDERTGTMGYIVHSFNPDNFFQSIIGNSVIAIAPFFGGALAIYLITWFLLPDFSLFTPEVPRVYYITPKNAFSWQSYLLFGKTMLLFFKYLLVKIKIGGLVSSWQFYVFFFIVFGIANHLSPSGTDFKNFWQPAFVFFFFVTLLNIIILPFTKNSMEYVHVAARYIMLAMPVLLLATVISFTGFIIVYIFYLFIAIFKS